MHVGGDAKEPTKLEQSNSWFFNLIKILIFSHCDRPGRQIVTFLLVANISMWFINTLIKGHAAFRPHHLEFFGIWAWVIIVSTHEKQLLIICKIVSFHRRMFRCHSRYSTDIIQQFVCLTCGSLRIKLRSIIIRWWSFIYTIILCAITISSK